MKKHSSIPDFSSVTSLMTSLQYLLLLTVTCAVLAGRFAEGARILGVFPIPSISHQVVYRKLSLELNKRGHQLVVVTPDPVNNTRLNGFTEIDVSSMYKAFQQSNKFSTAKQEKRPSLQVLKGAFLNADYMCETILSHEKVISMIDRNNTKEHFDLIILEWFLTPCMVAFSHRFSAPMIGISSLPLSSVFHDAFGNPTNPSYIPVVAFPYTDKNRTFWQRLETVIFNLRLSRFFYGTTMPRQDAIVKRYFGPSTPYIGDLHMQASMLFMTCMEGFHSPRPNVPAVVYINGFHIRPPKALPQDIQKFLDEAPKGVIYFSLGSNARSDQLTPEKRNIFVEAFTELRDYHVLWKWESDNLPGQPANVMIAKWMPQQDVLRHPKIKVFITQGGIQSTEEAIQMKVPMLGIPMFGDQDYQTKVAEDRGVSIRLEMDDVNKTVLLEALRKLIEDESYRENMERLSAVVNDQPMKPLERAVWWTEYVLRHKGAKHLRTAAVDMPWYTYLLLDVILFLLTITSLVIILLYIFVKFIVRKAKLCFLGREKVD